MPGLIDRHARTPLTLRQRAGIVDGKPTWREYSCRGMILDFSARDIDYFGAIRNGKIFLVAPFEITPELPGTIVFGGREYDIKGIKTYRNLRGVLYGYRMAVAGAS